MPAVEFYLDRTGSIRKSVIIYRVEGSVHSPIMYISKPKWRTEEEFSDLLDRMEIMIKPKSR